MDMTAPGATLSGGTSTSEFTMPIHQQGLIGGINLSWHSPDSSDEPMHQLGSGYYDIGQPGDEWALPSMEPAAGSIGPIDPDVLRNVTMVG
jgi:hypothetical protein